MYEPGGSYEPPHQNLRCLQIQLFSPLVQLFKKIINMLQDINYLKLRI